MHVSKWILVLEDAKIIKPWETFEKTNKVQHKTLKGKGNVHGWRI